MLLSTIILTLSSCFVVFATDYKITAATAWVTEPLSVYPDFSVSLTPNDYRPSVFQYSYQSATTLFTCTNQNCSQVSLISMPGLRVAEFAYGGVSPRRIAQESPVIPGAKFFLSIGYARPNHNIELVVCQANDSDCSKPQIITTADSFGFGTPGLRLTFTRPDGLPIMLIPQAKYASRDNRVTGYTIEACTDPLCQGSRSRTSLPFNLTGKADCEGTSVDVGLNRLGLPTWATLCRKELNLIHCLTPSCNETLVNQFQVNSDLVYFVYLAVDTEHRFTIATTGQIYQSDITYIRCLNPDCTDSVQSQLTIANRSSPNRSPIGRVQVVIDPSTNLPVFHLTGSTYPGDVPIFMFVACQDIECDMSRAIYVNYGGDRFGLSRSSVCDFFADNHSTMISSCLTKYRPSNETINFVVQMAKTDQPEADKLTFVQPKSLF